jgi:peptide/nickel transport system substrate-binding protein
MGILFPRIPRALAGLVIGAIVAGAVVVIPRSVTGSAAGPTTFVWGKAGDADTLDNNVSSNGETSEVTAQIFNTLVRAKPGATDVEPDLATTWSVSPDGLVWTFQLRRGVTFQDGTPWNAEAAKFNFDRWSDPNNPYHGVKPGDYYDWNDFMAGTFQEARVAGPYTLQLVLKAPNAPLLYSMSIIGFEFASPAAVQKYGAQDFGQHPVGTGPYTFVEWVRDDHVTLAANPAFFRKGLPKTQRVIMRVIPDNSARYLALKADEIQAMESPNPDDVKSAAADPNLKLVYRPPFNVGYLRFNMSDDLFKDKRIRQAVAYAIDRKTIVQALYGGYGQVADQHLPPMMWGRTRAAGYAYDPDKAKGLLAEAQYPSGFSFDFWYIPVSRPYFPNGKDIATAIASDLAKVGIRAHLVTEDWAAYLKDNQTDKFGLFMGGWIGESADPDAWLGHFYGRYAPHNAILSYNNPAVFDLVNRARIVSDQAERARLYAQAEAIVLGDYRDIPIAYASVPLVMRKNVQGLIGQPDAKEYMELVSLQP